MIKSKDAFPVYSIFPGKKFYSFATSFGFYDKRDDISDLVGQKKYRERYEQFKQEIIKLLPAPSVEFDDKEMRIDFIGFSFGDYYLTDIIDNLREREQFSWLHPIGHYQTLISRAHQTREKKELIEKAEAFYEKQVNPLRLKLDDCQDLVTTNFVVSEAHEDLSPKRFLIENLFYLKKQGYDTLFMEHLFNDTMQTELEHYMNSASDAEMPPSLKARLQGLDKGHLFNIQQLGILDKYNVQPSSRQYTYTNLVMAAKKAGIRVIGIDSSLSYEMQKVGIGSTQLDLPKRIRIFNYKASSIIDEEVQSGRCKKWVALMGNTHAEQYAGYSGVAQIQGAQTVLITDNYLKPPEHATINNNSWIAVDENNSLQYSFSIETHPATTLSFAVLGKEIVNENDNASTFKV
ncbi:membrane-targeted effector domain-containing toxin [Legionella jamestowniensis]|uniref:Uncharacterized protein n=1 Tax=Legionella jamestowniensis TaxID=455 RepID=A0A0W0UKH3_9GAMM|nr:membrane-targeted effector domain-containing toxin [Legionella jamestowniensis]KTD08309.1 hypothetical protein Ljam_2504 [Legionella jamestowniensis]SFL49554.1 hypothetical protein SAMN02746073_0441 [Legionella jamestowniensis DSM 19215]